MKFVAFLLMGCMLVLSSFTGMVKTVVPGTKHDCCKNMQNKNACQHQQKQTEKDDCSSPGCNMLLTCGICGFLAVEPLRIQPTVVAYLVKPVSLYQIGALSNYHASDWKPPKTV